MDEAQVRSIVEAYRQAFLAINPEALTRIWDRGHQPLIYIAMEKRKPIRGWAAISRYFAELPHHLAAMSVMTIENLAIDILGDAALACFDFSAQVWMNDGRSAAPAGRVSMMLRRAGDGWHVIHYHESALAAVAVDRTRQSASS